MTRFKINNFLTESQNIHKSESEEKNKNVKGLTILNNYSRIGTEDDMTNTPKVLQPNLI